MVYKPHRVDLTTADPVHEILDRDSTAIMSVYSNSASVTGGTVIAYEDGVESSVRINPYGTSAGNTGELRFQELTANGTNITGFKAPDSLAADVVYVLPDADGSANQVLSTDGSGNLGWTTVFADFSATPQTLAGNTNDYALPDTTGTLIITNTGNVNLRGIVAQANGFSLNILNIGTNRVRIQPENTNSAAANRFGGNGNIDIQNGQSITVIYNTNINRWITPVAGG